MEGEYAGEDLRIEVSTFSMLTSDMAQRQLLQLLEAMVERPPPRPLVDEFGVELGGPVREEPLPASPTSDEPKKPPPRPYISRTRSSEISPSSTIGRPQSPTRSVTLPTSPVVGARPYLARQSSTTNNSTDT